MEYVFQGQGQKFAWLLLLGAYIFNAVLLSQGEADPLIPRAGSERLAAILRSAGADVEVAWQAASHGLVVGDVAAAQRWMAARLE